MTPLARATGQRDEALKFQAATGEILKVIRGSPSDTQPVFEMIVRNAVSLCNGFFASAFRYDGERLHLIATSIVDPAARKFLAGQYPRPPDKAQMSGRAILARKVVRMEDALADPLYDRRHAEIGSWRRMLGVPMMDQGEPIGVIVVSWADAGPIPKAQEELLKTFADQAVIAIENVRLFNETKEALEKQTATAGILRVISSTPTDTTPVFEAIVRNATRLCEAAFANVFRYDGERLHWAASDGWPAELLAELKTAYPTTPNRSRVAGRVILEGRAVQVEDTHRDSEYDKTLGRSLRYRRILGVPLLREGGPVGVITVGWAAAGPIERRHEDLLKTFADQAVIAIENVRLFSELQERNLSLSQALEQQTASGEILEVISSSQTDLQAVFDTIIRNSVGLGGADLGTLLSLDDGRVDIGAHYNVDPQAEVAFRSHFPQALNADSVYGRAMLEGASVNLADFHAAGVSSPAAERARALGIRAALAVPLMRQGRPIGAIAVGRRAPGVFPEAYVALLKTFADQAVIAIENVRLFNETKEALERQTATAEILRVISETPTDTGPVFDAIVQATQRLVAAKQTGLVLRQGSRFIVAGYSGGRIEDLPEEVRDAPLDATKNFPSKAILGARVVHVTDWEGDDVPEHERLVARTYGVKSGLFVPLVRKGEGIGAIVVLREAMGRFEEKEVSLLQSFADQAVIAIENVRLFNETKEALERQTATSEILGVISGSPTNIQPVLDAVASTAARLCEAKDAIIQLREGDVLRFVAHHGALPNLQVGETRGLSRDLVTGRAILEGRQIHVHDLQAETKEYPRGSEIARQFDYRTILATPLMREGVAIGSIMIRRAEARPFTPTQLALMRTFADQAVIAIENVRLFNETKEALERQTATAEVLKVISASPTDVAPVFDAILRSAVTLCGAELAAVFPFDGKLVHLGATHNWPPAALQYFSKVYPSPPSSSLLSGRTILTRSLVEIADAAADEHYDPDSVATGHWRRMLGAPMLREGRPLGALVVAWRDPGETPRRQVELLQTFADQAAIAIENVRLFNETKEALEQQTAISDILRVISSSPQDLGPVFESILSHAIALCEGSRAVLWQFDGERLQFVAHKNGSPGGVAYLKENPLEPGSYNATPRAALERRAIHIVDAFAEPGYRPLIPSGELPDSPKTPTVLAVPLLRDEDVLGVITIWRHEVRPFSEKQIATVSTFAAQAVIAIENVRLFNETKEALDQQKASAEVLGAISGSIADTKPVFEKILASCERLFEGELVGITLADGDTVRLAAYHGPQGEQLKNVYPLPLTRESGTGWAILNARIAHFPDIEGAGVPPGVVAGCRTLGVRAIVFAPMLFEGKGIGAIWVARAQPGAFTDKQIAQLRTFADQAVIAIQNARLFNETKEALDQQRASAEVLHVISSSVADTEPVFEIILRSCERLFAGLNVGINVVGEDGRVHIAAYHGHGREELGRHFPVPLSDASGSGAAILRRAIVHYPDVEAPEVPEYARLGGKIAGSKSVIFAPMLWEGHAIGAIFVGRDFTGPFSDKEIALLKTFADQAVIAIQNARLFREIQEKSAQLEIANKHKSEFLANMSHELRTPLNAIIGFSEVLSERMFGEVNEKQAEYLKDIHESGRHLLSLINDILDLSKIEAGRMELELSSFDLPGAVSNAMTLVRERAQRHGIQLGLDMDPRLGEFQADERKVKQILLNLLSNAVKFTPDGGKVDVSTRKVDGRIEIAVRDTGIGIAPEDHASVFEEFKQVGRDYTRKAEGTGLGLALTKRLVELHGGEIALESAPGKGSTFTVRLPLR